jgi:O-antigen/teichoic acid export membrane protein
LERNKVVATLLAFGGVQGLIAVSSFLRLPFLVKALGPGRLGLNLVIGGIAPVFLATASGLRLSSRALMAEQVGKADQDSIRTAASLSRRLGWKVFIGQAIVTTPLVVVLPMYSWFGARGLVGHSEFVWSLVISAWLCAASAVGATAWGGLEGLGRTAIVNSFVAIVTVAGLAMTLALAAFTHSFIVFALLNTGTSAAPYYFAPWVLRTKQTSGTDDDKLARHTFSAAAAKATGQAIAPLATRATDPIVIGTVLGPSSVGEYGIAQRLSLVTTMVPAALAPLAAFHVAKRRGANNALSFRRITAVALFFASISLVVGLALVALGPWLVTILGAGKFHVGRGVFVAFLVLGVVFSIQIALSSCASGPAAMRLGLFVDLPCMALNLVLSVIFVRRWGIAGPVVASAIAVGVDALLWAGAIFTHPDLLTEVHAVTAATPISDAIDAIE